MTRLRLIPIVLLLCHAQFSAARVYSQTLASHRAPTEGRYAYVLGCGATLTKLDPGARRELANVSLARKTNLIQLTGDTGGSTFDGCATYSLAYTPQDQTLYTVAPETGSYQSGGRHFQLLAFHVPDLAFASAVPLPGAVSEEDEHWLTLEMDRTGALRVRLGLNRIVQLTAGKLEPLPGPAIFELPSASAEPATGDTLLDSSGYRLIGFPGGFDKPRIVCQEQQRSGDTTLIRFEGPDGQAWAAVHASGRTIVALHPGFKTTDESYRLAPGGGEVLIQEVAAFTTISLPLMGPRLALLDATTGTVLHQWNKPSPTPRLVALSPSGIAIFYAKQHFSFLTVGIHFPAEPINDLLPRTPVTAETIFADR